MWLDVNGKRMQTGNTGNMIFNCVYLVSYLSQFMTLMPGDIITTGTPPGVGSGLTVTTSSRSSWISVMTSATPPVLVTVKDFVVSG